MMYGHILDTTKEKSPGLTKNNMLCDATSSTSLMAMKLH